MKHIGLKLLMIASLSWISCTDSAVKEMCETDECWDESTLAHCVRGIQVLEYCHGTCQNAQCVDACVPRCLDDAKTLVSCINGQENKTICKGTCRNAQCVDACVPRCLDDAKTLVSCINGQESTEICENGCRNAACLAQSCQTRCEDEKTLVICENGTERTEVCDNKCQDSQCIKDEIKECPMEPVCLEDGHHRRFCNGDAVETKACEFGCLNGECLKSPKDPACKGIHCESGTCDRGICVTDEMRTAKAGDSCAKGFMEFCSGDSMVYCNSLGRVVVNDCSQKGGCGVVFDTQGLNVWCNGDSLCHEEGEAIRYCSTYKGQDYVSRYVCSRNSEGGLTARDQFFYGEYKLCEEGCNADKTDCYKETQCDYVRKCEGNSLRSCKDFSGAGFDVATSLVDCTESGNTCTVVNGSANCYQSCEQAGSKEYACMTNALGQEISIEQACTPSGGQNYFVQKNHVCPRGCQADTGECIKVIPAEGDLCLEASFEARCEGNIAISCPYQYVTALDCAHDYAEPRTCVMGDAGPTCLKACANEGDKAHECRYDPYYEGDVIVDTSCARHGDLLLADEDISIFCFSGCNATATDCQYDESQECTAESVTDHCDGDIRVSCEISSKTGKGTVSAENCRQYGEDYTCAIALKELGCYEQCSELGKRKTICSAIYGLGSVSQEYECWYDDGINKLVYQETSGTQPCANGCNDEATACR